MHKLNKLMGALAAVFLLGGFLLVFGAVGGMDNPDQSEHFLAQVITAVVGLAWMWLGTRLLQD